MGSSLKQYLFNHFLAPCLHADYPAHSVLRDSPSEKLVREQLPIGIIQL